MEERRKDQITKNSEEDTTDVDNAVQRTGQCNTCALQNRLSSETAKTIDNTKI